MLQVYRMPCTSFIPLQYTFQHTEVLHTWKHPPPLPLKQTVYMRLLNLKCSLYSLQTGNCWYVPTHLLGMFEQTNSDHYVNPDTIILGIKWTRKSMPIHFIWNKWRTIFEKKLLILQDKIYADHQEIISEGARPTQRLEVEYWEAFPK